MVEILERETSAIEPSDWSRRVDESYELQLEEGTIGDRDTSIEFQHDAAPIASDQNGTFFLARRLENMMQLTGQATVQGPDRNETTTPDDVFGADA